MPATKRSSQTLICALALSVGWLAPPRRVYADVSARLVKDINATPVVASSDPADFVQLGNRTYFLATTPENGRAVWATNGTEAGTQLVVDPDPGSAGTDAIDIDAPAKLGQELFFIEHEHDSNASPPNTVVLWKTDGTAPGIASIARTPGEGASALTPLVSAGGHVFFPVLAGATGTFALWASDGTPDGTHPVSVISDVKFPYYYDPEITALGASVVFIVSPSGNGIELWRSDGTIAGTQRLRAFGDFYGYHRLTRVGHKVFFSAFDQASGSVALWETDGTVAGTVRVRGGFSQESELFDLIAVGDSLFFTGADAVQPAYALWRSDGTAKGTMPVVTLDHGALGFASAGQRLCFITDSGGPQGLQLWSSDGTTTGTAVLLTAQSPSPDYATYPRLGSFGNRVLFTFPSDTSAASLWETDGTANDTHVVDDINRVGDPNVQFGFNEMPFFFGANDGTYGGELWTSDGTPSGTRLVANIAPDNERTLSSDVADLTRVGSTVFFTAHSGGATPAAGELWKTDGTGSGTVKLTASRVLGPLVAVGERLFFGAESALWVSDGTASGTVAVAEQGSTTDLTAVGDLLFYLATGDAGVQLCRSDGTPAGTFCMGSYLSPQGSPRDLVAVGAKLFFVSGLDQEPWVVADGNTPQQVRDILPSGNHPGPGSRPHSLAALDDTLIFFADDGVHGFELWRSDGTEAGTSLIADINPGKADSETNEETMVEVNGKLYFAADDGVHGMELWRSDGTAAGTELVGDLVPGSQGSYPLPLRAGGRLFVSAHDGSGSWLLWAYDEASASFVRLLDPFIGATSFELPSYFSDAGGRLVFTACDDHGCEPWQSDGTPAGTHRLADIARGAASSSAASFTALGSQLLLSANDNIHGQELWAIPLSFCEGDCDGNAIVSVAELVTGVGIVLGQQDLSACPAFDANGDGTVTIADVITAVGRALSGCSSA